MNISETLFKTMMSHASIHEDLLVNEAGLILNNNSSSTLYVWAQAVDCYLCDLLKLNEGQTFWKFETSTNWNLELRNNTNFALCRENNVDFGEHGTYQWNYNDSCLPISVINPPENPYKPVYYFETIFLILLCMKASLKFLYRKRSLLLRRLHILRDSVPVATESDLRSADDVKGIITAASHCPVVTPETRTKRIRSLDIFRGITILLMIFVNCGGGQYWIFQHAPWNGVTIADLIFPWFAWIMGVGIAMKIKSELRNCVRLSSLTYKVCIRAVTLILLGVILTNLRRDNLETLRIPGVLQKLGVSYFIVALLESIFMKPQHELMNIRLKQIEDLVESWKQWSIVATCVLVHTVITFYLPVPNCPVGYTGPGGLYNHSSAINCTGGAAGYIDKLIFTEKHLYPIPTCQKLYHCSTPYDPEGLLGILTTILCVYMGVHAGRILLVYKSTKERITRWLIWSFIAMTASGLLCNFSINEGVIPLNKSLSSLSYTLFSSGLAFLLLCVLFYVTDDRKWFPGSPFYQTGMNSLLLFIAHDIFSQTFPWQWKAFNKSSHAEYFIMDMWATLLWSFIAVMLYRYELFLTV